MSAEPVERPHGDHHVPGGPPSAEWSWTIAPGGSRSVRRGSHGAPRRHDPGDCDGRLMLVALLVFLVGSVALSCGIGTCLCRAEAAASRPVAPQPVALQQVTEPVTE